MKWMTSRPAPGAGLPLGLLLWACLGTPGAQPAVHLTLSAGETDRSINNADSPRTGIYHAGLKGAWSFAHAEIGALIETGGFNDHLALGSVGEVKAHHAFFQESLRLGLGGGIDFQSYYRGNYRGVFDTVQRHAVRTVPMVVSEVQVVRKAFIEYQRNFDNEIFWKLRIGYRIWK